MSDPEEKKSGAESPEKAHGTKTDPPAQPVIGPDCLVVVYARDPKLQGMRFDLRASPTRIGRGGDNEVALTGDSVSRRHAHVEKREERWFVADDGSTNGTFCNDEPVARERRLKNGDLVRIGGAILRFLTGPDLEAQYQEEIYRLTIMDGLTQLPNRRCLFDELETEVTRSRRRDRELAVLVLNIEDFQRICDEHGSLAGDLVVREVVKLVQPHASKDGIFSRCDVTELCLVLPETSIDAAFTLGDELWRKVRDHRFEFEGRRIKLGIDIGCVVLVEKDRNAVDLMKRALEALNEAKIARANRAGS